MTLKLIIVFIYLFFSAQLSVAQKIEVFSLANKETYSEKNFFRTNPSLKIIQQISYSGFGIDTQSEMYLLLEIKDLKKLRDKKVINIKTDTAILSCLWEYISTWNLEKEKTDINGQINVLSWSKKEIELELNLDVVDLRKNRIYVYSGKRFFYKANRKKKWDNF
jgi:hypothetical protein